MDKKIELKDSLYYSDLMYEIRKLANFGVDVDFETWERIAERKKDIRIYEKIGDFSFPSDYLSPFKEELLEIIRGISKKANTTFGRYERISEYPLLVLEVLVELENRELENEMLIHLVSIIKDMGLENKFSLGESREQSVCLNKTDNLWKVYVVERGTSFEKSVFEECFDACVEVINQLADSKQMYEEAKEKFGMVKKLIPNK